MDECEHCGEDHSKTGLCMPSFDSIVQSLCDLDG
jgi:hypothetical protein